MPDSSWSVATLAATGERTSNTYLAGDGVFREPAGTGGGTGAGDNALGSLNNPVTVADAPRPTGLTRVVWDCATDPANWAVGDYNLQRGT